MISRLMWRSFRRIKILVHKQSLNDNSKSGSMAAVGLGLLLLTQISSQAKKSSNMVVKPVLRLQIKPAVTAGCSSHQPQQYSCYLKACHLCNKGLSLDREVYMYRGDIGFCSVVCRDRQIVLDEMKELEASTKQMLAAYRSRSCRRIRSNVLTEDVHLQKKRIHSRQTIFAL